VPHLHFRTRVFTRGENFPVKARRFCWQSSFEGIQPYSAFRLMSWRTTANVLLTSPIDAKVHSVVVQLSLVDGRTR
jgi:hypothetical protein